MGAICREDPETGPQVADLSHITATSSDMVFELLKVGFCKHSTH